MEKYNKETKECEPFSSEIDNALQPLDLSITPSSQQPIDIRDIHKLEIKNDILSIDQRLMKYFTPLLQDEKRALSLSQSLTNSLNVEELEIFSAHLETLKFKSPSAKYDEVTSAVVSQLEKFVLLIKTKNLDSMKHLQENHIEVYQELREAFVKAKILKNRLRFYFKALYGVELSAKIILTQLRIIDSEMFADANLKNKKKATATYSISG